jgi:hypothetical protein
MNPSNFFKTLKIIHLAMLAGLAAFAVVIFFLTQDTQFFSLTPQDDFFALVVPIVLFSGIIMSSVIYKKFVSKGKTAKDLPAKTSIYLTSNIIRYALIEGPVLLALVIFNLNNNLLFLALAGIGILYFLSVKPNPAKISRELDLTYEEKAELGIK